MPILTQMVVQKVAQLLRVFDPKVISVPANISFFRMSGTLSALNWISPENLHSPSLPYVKFPLPYDSTPILNASMVQSLANGLTF